MSPWLRTTERLPIPPQKQQLVTKKNTNPRVTNTPAMINVAVLAGAGAKRSTTTPKQKQITPTKAGHGPTVVAVRYAGCLLASWKGVSLRTYALCTRLIYPIYELHAQSAGRAAPRGFDCVVHR